MGCTIRFTTETYDEAIKSYFALTPPVTRLIEGAKVTYTFFGCPRYKLIVNENTHEISVESWENTHESTQYSDDKVDMKMVLADSGTIGMGTITANKVVNYIMDWIKDEIRSTLPDQFGLIGNLTKIHLDVDTPNKLSEKIKKFFANKH